MINSTPRRDVEEVDSPELALIQLRYKFHDQTKEIYPDVRYPEMVWLFDVALGMDPRPISEHPITKKQYKTFIVDGYGNRELNPLTGNAVTVTRSFTAEQRKIVREWWPLLPEEMKY